MLFKIIVVPPWQNIISNPVHKTLPNKYPDVVQQRAYLDAIIMKQKNENRYHLVFLHFKFTFFLIEK